MEYHRLTLKGSKADVIEDIKKVYPEYPEDYERIGESVHERFIVTEPRQEVIEPAEIDENGNETKAAILGDWKSNLVLPISFDISVFNTAQ